MSHTTVRRLVPIVLLAFLVSGCAGTLETMQNNPKAFLGGAAGAAGGGLIAAAAGGGAAGIVGGVRFRNTLKSSGDAIYILLATGIGLAAARRR